MTSEFVQAAPELKNTYLGNRWLKPYLRSRLPNEMFAAIDSELEGLGRKCANEYLLLARAADRQKPVHIPFDPWGRRIDEIKTSGEWNTFKDISAIEGLVALGYSRGFGAYSRVHQFAKLYLFHPSSAFFTCPLAMADGAAKVLEDWGRADNLRRAFQHLTSRDPAQFWTSGQWMTEKAGGSDVSQTSTEARIDESGRVRLFGTKWFSSATTSEMALALARLPGSVAGSRGLTLFFVEMRQPSGELNHIRVLRLKDKLGTWALPTAELSLEGAFATQVGEKDQGVKTVATMLNVTRLYNSVCSIGQMARGLDLLTDYSSKRTVFGAKLETQVLHYTTFVDEEIAHLAGFLLTFELVHLLGKEECKNLSSSEAETLRLMTPVCKLFTARNAVRSASEVIEGFGGAGYIEDTGIPVQLRDSQIFPIWEGATNVLSLDMLRVLRKPDAFKGFQTEIEKNLGEIRTGDHDLASVAIRLQGALKTLGSRLTEWATSLEVVQIESSKSLAFYLARFYACVLLAAWANRESEKNRNALRPWLEHFLESYLGDWNPVTKGQIERKQRQWGERLS